MKRTHTCGQLNRSHLGTPVRLSGWVHRIRDHGGVYFVDLRDRYGITQLVLNPEVSPQAHALASRLRAEYVISAWGAVVARPEGTVNTKLPTGEIEIKVDRLEILSEAKTPPFPISDDVQIGEDVRLKYRYLDLRRPYMHKNLILRHNVVLAARRYLSEEEGFIEVETPILTKSTPEGARDYLVPSRIEPGSFYALPQSPQLLKQLLMIANIDKYFQICRCFRDEDLRADRQPEFTQIDMEMSFVEQDDIFRVVEGLMRACFKAGLGLEIPTPFPRMSHADAADRYGTDKPDTRYEMLLQDVTDLVRESRYEVFRSTIEKGGVVKGIRLPGCARYSRKNTDDLAAFVSGYAVLGLSPIKVRADGFSSPLSKHFEPAVFEKLVREMGGTENDLLVLVAGPKKKVNEALGALRIRIATEERLIPEGRFDLFWVVDFPLFSYNEEEQRLDSEHHPFTSPAEADFHLLDTDPLKVRSSSYDLVLNGVEVGSGSVRIHNSEVQKKIFRLLKLTEEEIEQRFGFFTEALQYGTPPHAGIAPGLDRIIRIMAGADSIRDVIAFPKTQRASDAMSGSPSPVSDQQLRELHIKVVK
ncbi:MAG: aspartate--tRNA ligase [bacterium]|nr:aspartate--tRNA ligase [bacterium]